MTIRDDTDHEARLELPPTPDAVTVGRRFVVSAAREAGAGDLADDAAIVASELLANAVQHGKPPVVVTVNAAPGELTLEVHDCGPHALVRPIASSGNMTGRGLLLVEQLSARWGVRRDTDGKSVWCTLIADSRRPEGALASFDPLDFWDDEPAHGHEEPHYTVELGDIPTDLLVAAKAHIDNLVREFSLAATGNLSDGVKVPADLARLITTVVHGFADARASMKQQATAAAHRGDARTAVSLNLALSSAAAGEAYLDALDQADRYARAARLLTLAAPPEHRLFRRWYVRTVVEQLRQVARGEPPTPAVPFEDVLVAEVRRLSQAQRVADRMARLQRVTAALARARTPEDVARVVVREGAEALDASGGSLLVPGPDGRHLAVPGAVGYRDDFVRRLRDEEANSDLPAATAMRTGEPIWLETTEERDTHFPALRGFEPTTVAICAVPVVAGADRLGALRFSFSGTRLFDDDERQFVLALAALCGQTLQRAEVHQAEQRAALALQRALLPTPLAAIRGWDVAAHYSPAGDQEVGGDFYELLPLPDGRIAAVVGDVMGRGVDAAAAMAQIRTAIRAYIVVEPEPSVVMRKIDRFLEVIGGDNLVTALYFLTDADSDVVTIANAGHIQPVLVTPGNGSEVVTVESGLPFGVEPGERPTTTLRLPPGAAVVAFTDGLVERRGEDIDDGIARMLAGIDASAASGAADLVESIVASASAERVHDDDVTVLVLRRRPLNADAQDGQ